MDRLVGDVMGSPLMMAEAMTIKNQNDMKEYIQAKGYELTENEMLEVWKMASKVMKKPTP